MSCIQNMYSHVKPDMRKNLIVLKRLRLSQSHYLWLQELWRYTCLIITYFGYSGGILSVFNFLWCFYSYTSSFLLLLVSVLAKERNTSKSVFSKNKCDCSSIWFYHYKNELTRITSSNASYATDSMFMY